jgi:predicted RND superfamily exporter protein
LPNLKIEPYPIEQLPEDSTIKKSDKIINEDFYGTLPYFIEIDTGGEGLVLNVESLKEIDKIHTLMDSSRSVGYSYSLLTVLKQLSFYFEGNSNLLLDDTGMNAFVAEQYLLYYSSSVDPLEYESLVNSSYRVFSIKGLIYYKNVDTLTEFYNLIDHIILSLPEGWSLKVHGMVSELKAEEISLKKNWVFSFVAGSLMIFIVVLIFYKKLSLALLSLIPGIISMIFSFGLISLAGISIDAFSIIFVAIIIGLVIDYSIHTLGAIDSLNNLDSVEDGFSFIINYSGKPIFLSFLTSIFSFSVLFLSSFKGARTLGLLLFSSLLVSFFLSVYLLPIIILPYKLKKGKLTKKDLS